MGFLCLYGILQEVLSGLFVVLNSLLDTEPPAMVVFCYNKYMSKLRGMGSNCFDNALLQSYYDEIQQCYECGRYNASDFHHSVPRANNYAGSLLNAVPLCRHCHSNHSFVTRLDNQQKYFEKVVLHLVSNGYKFNNLDIQYIDEYRDKFEAILISLLSKDKI